MVVTPFAALTINEDQVAAIKLGLVLAQFMPRRLNVRPVRFAGVQGFLKLRLRLSRNRHRPVRLVVTLALRRRVPCGDGCLAETGHKLVKRRIGHFGNQAVQQRPVPRRV